MVSIKSTQVMVQLGQLMRVGQAPRTSVQSLLKDAREFHLPMLPQPNLPLPHRAERIIDAVKARAGHDSEDQKLSHQAQALACRLL